MDFYSRLLHARRSKFAYYLLKALSAEVPIAAKVGEGTILVHGGFGVVIHPNTTIGKWVKIYPGVTVGRADIHLPVAQSKFESIEIGDEAILSPGSKILCKEGVLRVGSGTVIGANAVLLESTGEGEVWAGVPAKKVGMRESWQPPQPSDQSSN